MAQVTARARPVLAALSVAALIASAPAPATAAPTAKPHLRVIVPRAPVRTGPAFTFRELYRASSGEVFEVVDRNGAYWFRVVLPDGRFGWIYGEQVLPFEVQLEGSLASQRWDTIKRTLFAPSPIIASSVGLAFSGGAVGGNGSFMFRPSVTLDSHFSIEAHLGEVVGKEGSLLLYGIGGDVLIYPIGPFIPFVSLGAGAGTAFPKVNGVTQSPKTQFAIDAGAGAMLVLVKRIVLRFDFRNYTLFTPNTTENLQEYSGGLAVYF
jgi:hypothetical protein